MFAVIHPRELGIPMLESTMASATVIVAGVGIVRTVLFKSVTSGNQMCTLHHITSDVEFPQPNVVAIR